MLNTVRPGLALLRSLESRPYAYAGRTRRRGLTVVLALTTAVTIASGANMVFEWGDTGERADRERQLVSAYEKRLREMRLELDALRTRQAVEQVRLARKAERLEQRSDWILQRGLEVGGDDVASSGLRLIDRAAQADILTEVEVSLAEAERRQMGDIAKLGIRLAARARKLAKILKLHGVQAPKIAQGGPMIALKGAVPFGERMAAFEEAQERYKSVRLSAEALPQGSPVPGRKISSRFGSRRDPLNGRQALHGGLDFKAPKGARVQATAAGTVKFAGRKGGYGKLVILDHANGITTRYGHLSRINVSKGDRIARGSVIGRVGSTGRSTGPHLHYEVRRRGQVRDPAHYVRLGRVLKPLM